MTFPWKALYIFCISVLSKHNLNIKDVLIETMQWLDHTFLYPKPQKLSKYEMSQLEFSGFFCRHVFCVSLLSFNYGVLVDIKHFIMWKLVLQLKSKDSLCKYCISLNSVFFKIIKNKNGLWKKVEIFFSFKGCYIRQSIFHFLLRRAAHFVIWKKFIYFNSKSRNLKSVLLFFLAICTNFALREKLSLRTKESFQFINKILHLLKQKQGLVHWGSKLIQDQNWNWVSLYLT